MAPSHPPPQLHPTHNVPAISPLTNPRSSSSPSPPPPSSSPPPQRSPTPPSSQHTKQTRTRPRPTSDQKGGEDSDPTVESVCTVLDVLLSSVTSQLQQLAAFDPIPATIELGQSIHTQPNSHMPVCEKMDDIQIEPWNEWLSQCEYCDSIGKGDVCIHNKDDKCIASRKRQRERESLWRECRSMCDGESCTGEEEEKGNKMRQESRSGRMMSMKCRVSSAEIYHLCCHRLSKMLHAEIDVMEDYRVFQHASGGVMELQRDNLMQTKRLLELDKE
eukprot:GHVQ01017972.1.p1 GENE.GHVQ01017972.1~~GHVQ01017972.1.p1  ORF type:complete len:274 (+),score=71.18 GHVQ01017972.1:393-1214(+)